MIRTIYTPVISTLVLVFRVYSFYLHPNKPEMGWYECHVQKCQIFGGRRSVQIIDFSSIWLYIDCFNSRFFFLFMCIIKNWHVVLERSTKWHIYILTFRHFFWSERLCWYYFFGWDGFEMTCSINGHKRHLRIFAFFFFSSFW